MSYPHPFVEIAGAISLFSAITIAYIYAKLQADKRRRQSQSRFQNSANKATSSRDAASSSLGILFGSSRRKS
jgi:hypothetical protein